MGLMMSVLVFSIGVLEAMSCVEHMRQSLLPLDLKRRRRRLVLDVGSGTIRHRETRRSSEFQRDPHAYLRSLTSWLPEEESECEELVAIFEAGNVHSTYVQQPQDKCLLAVSEGVGGRESGEGSEISRVSTPATVIENKDQCIDAAIFSVNDVTQEIDNCAIFLASPPESFPVNDDLEITPINRTTKNANVSKQQLTNEPNKIATVNITIEPNLGAKEKHLDGFCRKPKRENVARDNDRSEPSPKIAREGLISDKDVASEIRALQVRSSPDATSSERSIRPTLAANIESTIHRVFAGNQPTQQQTLLEACPGRHDGEGEYEPMDSKHSSSSETSNKYSNNDLSFTFGKQFDQITENKNTEGFDHQIQEKTILDEVAEKVSEWLGFKNDKCTNISSVYKHSQNILLDNSKNQLSHQKESGNDYVYIDLKSENIEKHEAPELQFQNTQESARPIQATDENNLQVDEFIREENGNLLLQKSSVTSIDESIFNVEQNISKNIGLQNIASIEIGGQNQALLDNTIAPTQNVFPKSIAAPNEKLSDSDEITVHSCNLSEKKSNKHKITEVIRKDVEPKINTRSNVDFCGGEPAPVNHHQREVENLISESVDHSTNNSRAYEFQQLAKPEDISKTHSRETLLFKEALEIDIASHLERDNKTRSKVKMNDVATVENSLSPLKSIDKSPHDNLLVKEPTSDTPEVRTLQINTELAKKSIQNIEENMIDNNDKAKNINHNASCDFPNLQDVQECNDNQNIMMTSSECQRDSVQNTPECGIEHVQITRSFSHSDVKSSKDVQSVEDFTSSTEAVQSTATIIQKCLKFDEQVPQEPFKDINALEKSANDTKSIHVSKTETNFVKDASTYETLIENSQIVQNISNISRENKETSSIADLVGSASEDYISASCENQTYMKSKNDSQKAHTIPYETQINQEGQPLNITTHIDSISETIENTSVNSVRQDEQQDYLNRAPTNILNVDQNENIISGTNITVENVDSRSALNVETCDGRRPESKINSSMPVLHDITSELQNTDSKVLQELLEVKEGLKPVTKDVAQELATTEPDTKSKEVEQRVHRLKSIDDHDVTVLEGACAPPLSAFSPVKDVTSPDKAFWLIFSGEYTKAMSKDWHSGHFCCWQCDESLTGQRYVLRDDHPYCIKCYEQVFANTCDECSKVIGIDSKDLSYKDKHWHEACFLCSKCRVSLVDKQFGSKADKIYCGNCYDAQFASRCDGCGQIFRAGTKKMEYKTRQWHEQCFCCCVCKTAIGTKSFIPREQEIYCAGCYEEKFATRCVKCNKIITSGGVTYKNEPWHRECFTCTNCSTSLAGQRFTSRDEKPYCADCFGELFAKRCTACCKPITGIGGTKFISFEDRHWHNDCFICASCRSSLVGRGFITDAEDILCTECAKQKLM